jgi:hypothetical protein
MVSYLQNSLKFIVVPATRRFFMRYKLEMLKNNERRDKSRHARHRGPNP